VRVAQEWEVDELRATAAAAAAAAVAAL